MQARSLRDLTSTILFCVGAACAAGCAKVGSEGSGSGGSGGGNGGTGGTAPPIAGLNGLTITPPTQTINLALDSNGKIAAATATYTAMGSFDDGSSKDVSTTVQWVSPSPSALSILSGQITVKAPGKYTIRARAQSPSGMAYEATADLIATFQGTFAGDGFDNGAKGTLDGNPSGSVQLTYPLDGALFPSNLGPIFVQITKNGNASSARLRFTVDPGIIDITWYGKCETTDSNGSTLPGTGCYVKLPLDFTKLFIGASQSSNITLTARVGAASGSASESQSIHVAWADVAVTGGLYYWSVIDPAAVQGYVSPEMPAQPTGTGIMRYDFSADNPAPQIVWTDRGPAPFSTTILAPQSSDPPGPSYGGHCVGCHAISNDGKFMALTIGGSSSVNGANFSLLDIGMKYLLNINPGARSDMNSSTTNNPTDYWKMFRKDTFATENSWSKDGDAMVSMYQSKLYLDAITIDSAGGTGTAVRTGLALPSWGEYQSDPFWSQDGKFLAFTSFQSPDVDTMNNPTGLNGDMKKGGTIAIADANGNTIMDDAKLIVPRQNGVTNYYPAISNDSKLIVYNQSTCGTDPDPVRGSATAYGSQSCDGYDDSSATLWLTDPAGRSPVKLDNANMGGSSNSWPRFSPDNGTFRGQKLYWIAYSSRRPYGLQVNYNPASIAAAKPQLWFSAVVVREDPGDPSYAPVWLPGQNLNQSMPNGNHVPQWVAVAVIIPQ